MPLLHSNNGNGLSGYELYRLREMTQDLEKAQVAHVLYLTDVALGMNGPLSQQVVAQSVCRLCDAYGAELMYQAVVVQGLTPILYLLHMLNFLYE